MSVHPSVPSRPVHLYRPLLVPVLIHYVRLEFQMIEKCDLSVLAFTISDFIVDYQI